jgi:hypothetical protein
LRWYICPVRLSVRRRVRPLDQEVARHVDLNHRLEPLVPPGQEARQGLGLRDGARKTVEDEPQPGVLAVEALVHESDDHLIGTSLPADMKRSAATPRGVPAARAARSMSPVEIFGTRKRLAQRRRLGPLAARGRPDENETHPFSPWLRPGPPRLAACR